MSISSIPTSHSFLFNSLPYYGYMDQVSKFLTTFCSATLSFWMNNKLAFFNGIIRKRPIKQIFRGWEQYKDKQPNQERWRKQLFVIMKRMMHFQLEVELYVQSMDYVLDEVPPKHQSLEELSLPEFHSFKQIIFFEGLANIQELQEISGLKSLLDISSFDIICVYYEPQSTLLESLCHSYYKMSIYYIENLRLEGSLNQNKAFSQFLEKPAKDTEVKTLTGKLFGHFLTTSEIVRIEEFVQKDSEFLSDNFVLCQQMLNSINKKNFISYKKLWNTILPSISFDLNENINLRYEISPILKKSSKSVSFHCSFNKLYDQNKIAIKNGAIFIEQISLSNDPTVDIDVLLCDRVELMPNKNCQSNYIRFLQEEEVVYQGIKLKSHHAFINDIGDFTTSSFLNLRYGSTIKTQAQVNYDGTEIVYVIFETLEEIRSEDIEFLCLAAKFVKPKNIVGLLYEYSSETNGIDSINELLTLSSGTSCTFEASTKYFSSYNEVLSKDIEKILPFIDRITSIRGYSNDESALKTLSLLHKIVIETSCFNKSAKILNKFISTPTENSDALIEPSQSLMNEISRESMMHSITYSNEGPSSD